MNMLGPKLFSDSDDESVSSTSDSEVEELDEVEPAKAPQSKKAPFCPECGRYFKKDADLINHTKSKHPQQFLEEKKKGRKKGNKMLRYLGGKARKAQVTGPASSSSSSRKKAKNISDSSDDSDEDISKGKKRKLTPGSLLGVLVNNEQFCDVRFLVGPGIPLAREEKKAYDPEAPSSVQPTAVVPQFPETPLEWTPQNVHDWVLQQSGGGGKHFNAYAKVFKDDGINGESLLSDFESENDFYMIKINPHKRKLLRELAKLKEKKAELESRKKGASSSSSAAGDGDTEKKSSADDSMTDIDATSPTPVNPEKEEAGSKKGVEKIYAIREILWSASPVFREMLGKDDNKDEFVVSDCTPEGFKTMLGYIYTGVAKLDEHNLMETMYAAHAFQMNRLLRFCSIYIKQKLSISNVCRFLMKSDVWMSEALMKFITVHADEVLTSPEFLKLSRAKVMNIIKSDKLTISAEIEVFRACVEWAERQLKARHITPSPSIIRKELDDIIRHIRFTEMGAEEFLGEVFDTELLTTDEILSVILYWQHDGKVEIDFNTNLRKKRHIDLVYESDFDTNGVIYFIGTDGDKETFSNPADARDGVKVTMSSTESGTAANITNRQSSQTYTQSMQGQTIELDIGEERLLSPNYYTIRHGFNSANYYPRNWVLEGCVPGGGSKWETLSTHNNDTAINQPQASASWEIDDINTRQSGDPKYHKFRIRMTGNDHSGSQYLMICGIELYGKLFLRDQHKAMFNQRKRSKRGKGF